MNASELRPRRLLVLVGVAVLLMGTAASSFYQRYLRCQNRANELAAAESLHRSKAATLEELATNLRQVASLAREMAGSSSSDFERAKWLKMASTEELKADKFDEAAVVSMTRADDFATKTNEYSSLAWRPWLPGPD